MKRPLPLLFAILTATATLVASRSWADGQPDDGKAREAAAHFARGVGLYESADWGAALVEFERAYATFAHYRVQYDIAVCRYRLHDYVGSLTAFEKYLADGDASEMPQKRREEVESMIHELHSRVAHVRVSTDLVGAEIDVDDVPVGVAPIAAPIPVSVGRRKIGASRDGRPIAVRYVDAVGEDLIVVDLEALPSAEPMAVVKPSRAGAWPLAPAFASFGVAVLGLGVSTGFAVAAIDEKKTLDRMCDVNGACPASSQPVIDRSRLDATFATAGLSVGLIGLGAGLAYLLIGHFGPSHSSWKTAAILPFVGPGAVGAAGAF
jgi:hypothetical protein